MPTWTIELVDDLDAPGWLPVPEGLSETEQNAWVSDGLSLLEEVVGTPRWDGEPATASDIGDILRMALGERATSEAYALFQVWPVASAAAVMCHLYVADAKTVPDPSDWDGVVHIAHADHLGPGLQLSARRQLEFDGGSVVVDSVNYLFTDGETTLILGIEESLPQLAAWVVRGLTALKDILRMTRNDGVAFQSVLPPGFTEDEVWQVDDVKVVQ